MIIIIYLILFLFSENFRVADDMPIESDLVVQALDKVQGQVEDYFKANRRQVFMLDEVTSSQRAEVYAKVQNYKYSLTKS